MPKRRKVLIGLGGSIALAGCSGGSGGEASEAVFEITNILDDETYSEGEQVSIGGTITNTGEGTGEQTIEYVFQGDNEERIETISLDPGEEREINHTLGDASTFDFGRHAYNLRTEDDNATGVFTIQYSPEESEPEPEPEPEADENIYEIGENFVVEEENLEITVTDVRSGETFGPNEADGVFHAVEMEITNTGQEAVDVYHSLFKMTDSENTNIRYEPDIELSGQIEGGINIYKTINPGITTTIREIFDIPSDVSPDLVIDAETEYIVNLDGSSD